MTDPTIPIGHRDGVALMEYLGNMGLEPDEGFLQEALQQLTQTVVELEAAKQIGAGRYEIRMTFRPDGAQEGEVYMDRVLAGRVTMIVEGTRTYLEFEPLTEE